MPAFQPAGAAPQEQAQGAEAPTRAWPELRFDDPKEAFQVCCPPLDWSLLGTRVPACSARRAPWSQGTPVSLALLL